LATRLAPHLVRPVPILVPLPAHRGLTGLVQRAWQRGYYGAGVGLYDAFATAAQLRGSAPRGMPLHRHLSRTETHRRFPSLRESAGMRVRASKGVHLVVPRSAITGEAGLILRTQTSVLFVIPWGGHWIIGTTDTDWNLDRGHPAASATDISYLLGQVNAVLD